MTDRSSLDAFERRLARDLAQYVAPAVDTRAASQIADAAMRPRGVVIRARSAWGRRRMLLLAVAAVLLLPTAWLVAGGASRRAPAPEAHRPIIEDLGPWTGGPAYELGSAVLADGRVLLAGGTATGSPPANAWLFDPATDRLDPAGAMNVARVRPSMVEIPGDRVFILGGDPPAGPNAVAETAEVYDLGTRTFKPTPSLPSARRSCPCGALNRLPWALTHATALLDGRVVVAGGASVDLSPSPAGVADVFDPAASTWSHLDIGCDATRSSQVLLADGRLLLVCVWGSATGGEPVTVRARVFDPAANTFSDAGTPPGPVSSGTLLADGRVLFTGFAPFIYDPATGSFQRLPAGPSPAGQWPGVALAGGGVLFLGVSGTPTMRFDPATGRFQELQRPGLSSFAADVTLRDGRVLTIDDRGVRLLDPSQQR